MVCFTWKRSKGVDTKMRKLSEILEDLTETIDMLIDVGMLDRDEKTLNRIESIEQELYDYARKLEN